MLILLNSGDCHGIFSSERVKLVHIFSILYGVLHIYLFISLF